MKHLEMNENKRLTREKRLAKHNKQCKHLIEYLISNKYPEGLTKNEARKLRNQAKTLRLIYGIRLVSGVSKSMHNTVYSIYYYCNYYGHVITFLTQLVFAQALYDFITALLNYLKSNRKNRNSWPLTY